MCKQRNSIWSSYGYTLYYFLHILQLAWRATHDVYCIQWLHTIVNWTRYWNYTWKYLINASSLNTRSILPIPCFWLIRCDLLLPVGTDARNIFLLHKIKSLIRAPLVNLWSLFLSRKKKYLDHMCLLYCP